MPPRLQAFDHVHVYVQDRLAAERWYAKVLGFTRSKELEFWATGGGPLTLENDTGSVHLALFERPAQRCRSTIALRVSGTEFLSWRTHLERELVGENTFEDHQASMSLYFADPDGNPYELTTYEVGAVKASSGAA
jgi:catechol-2,3-dioxygenase